MSERSRLRRFLGPKPKLSAAELTYLTKAWTGEEPTDKAATELAQAMNSLLAKE